MTARRQARSAAILVLVLLPGAGNSLGAEAGPLLARLKAVGREGAGNPEAGAAWRALVRMGPDALLPTLAALDDASPTAANWLRTAVDAIVEHELSAGRALPAASLEAFVRDTNHAGPGRRLAYECLVRVDSDAPNRLLPGMLNDPGAELRRDAVERALQEPKQLLAKGDKPAATAAYRKLLACARDREQVDLIAKELKQLGQSVDLAAQYGFITRWRLIGPFDNTGGAGFAKIFPPEKGVDLVAPCAGKKDLELRWIDHATTDPYGLVDLNKALGKNMGAVAYAFAVVDSPAERAVQLRAGSNNAVKLYLNGKQVCFREEYHHGTRMDQHIGEGTLKAGRNEVLIKVCQNEQTESWAQSWSFQLRLSDSLGGAVPYTLVTEKAGASPARDKGQP